MGMAERLRSDYKWLLDVNEMAFDPLEKTIGLRGISGVNRYPDSESQTLRIRLAELVSKTVDKAEWVNPNHLILGNGSDEVLKLLLEGLVDKGDLVLIPDPTFSEYERLAKITRTDFVKVDFGLAGFEEEQLIDAIKRTQAKLFFLSNPNNPTGGFLTAESIIKIANATEAIIVVDEAYGDFAGDSAIKCIKDNPRIIVVRTLSKSYGLAALRIGFLVADQSVIRKLSPYKMTYNISGVSEAVAIEVLRDISYVSEYINAVKQVRLKALELLDKIDGIKVYPSEANFVLLKIENESIYTLLYEVLEAVSMRVRWFKSPAESKSLLRCVRITLTSDKDFMAFYEYLVAVVEEERKVRSDEV